MKILIFVNTKLNIIDKNTSGGIETLNFELSNYLKKKKFFVVLSSRVDNKILTTVWDIIISSNDAKIFDITTSKRKILWLHNKLQIEKSLRKRQFFSILNNKIEAIFVSKYLEKNTSKFYHFHRRTVIPNFLPKIFIKEKNIPKKHLKKVFVWSVQRKKGLDYVLDLWVNRISPKHPHAEFHIFSINEIKKKKFQKYNIFFHGRVKRSKLISFYKKATGMICLGYDETFCLNALESMSIGLPVISLCETALSEIVINNINGIKIDNLSQLEKAIINLISLDNKQSKKLAHSAMKFSKKYHPSKILKVWETLVCRKD